MPEGPVVLNPEDNDDDEGNVVSGNFEISNIVPSSGIAVGEGATITNYYYSRVIPSTSLRPDEVDSAYNRLRQQIEQYFDIVAETLHDTPKLQDETLRMLQSAKEMLSTNEVDDPESVLSRAQFEVRKVHVAISKEQQAQNGEKRLRWIVPVIVIFYVAIIIGAIALTGSQWSSATEIPIIGVPISVVIWAAIGSVAAILYRFYTRSRNRLGDEIRWLIARPIIGILMGSLSYLAIVSGLIIFGAVPETSPTTAIGRPQLLWAIAFLGGFSDKFFEAIIRIMVSSQKKGVKSGHHLIN